MIIADWIFIGGALIAAFIGWLTGFGKCLKFFTGGIFGIIISVFVCYCLGGLIMNLGFVNNLLTALASLWAGKDGFLFDLLTKIRFEVIVYYVALFFIVQILRIIIVNVLKNVAESDSKVISFFNRLFGAVLLTAMALLLTLFVFQIIYWVGGNTLDAVKSYFEDSAIKLDYLLFEGNPLAQIVDYITQMIKK